MSFINSIRQKPHEYKVKVIWATAIITAAVLLLCWLLFSRIGENFRNARFFFKNTSSQVQQNGQEMYKENVK